jgi:hypothetical protein
MAYFEKYQFNLGGKKMKFFKIKGGVWDSEEFEEVTAARDYDTAIHEAYLMACESYDSYAGLHGIMSEQDYVDEMEAETFDEAWELYLDDRESQIEYEAVEITEEEYKSHFGEGML